MWKGAFPLPFMHLPDEIHKKTKHRSSNAVVIIHVVIEGSHAFMQFKPYAKHSEKKNTSTSVTFVNKIVFIHQNERRVPNEWTK